MQTSPLKISITIHLNRRFRSYFFSPFFSYHNICKNWYNMFFLPRKKAKCLSGKTFFSTTPFFLLKICINKMGVRYQSSIASCFPKCNWIVKIVFWSSINQGLFVTDSCLGQKVKKTLTQFANQKIIMQENFRQLDHGKVFQASLVVEIY